jgi:hypothetical protein
MSLFVDSCKTLGVIADLERRGCRVVSAHVLPSPAVHINQPPAEAHWAYAFRPLPRGACPSPVECFANLNGVMVTWFAGGVRHG